MKKLILILFILLLFPRVTFAAEPNNKFGISLLQPTASDIKKAAEMVNSQGGDYGYATLVIQENDRDRGKWQQIFDELRVNHLIPIVRLATRPEGENWRRPTQDEAAGWVEFLNSLNWVVKKKYIVLFNEPNHASEWGGEIDPEGYGEVAFAFSKALKEKGKDYIVMLSGFDAAAPSYGQQYEDEEIFLKRMTASRAGIFENIDAWASHSYPNPGFSGSPWDEGRRSVLGYQWELNVLKSLGVKRDLPVFITETGWVDSRLSRATVAQYYREAFQSVWLSDERVVAVTPFVFDYQTEPFLGFSWKQKGRDEFYPQYYAVQDMQKTKGAPEIIEKGTVTHTLPKEFVAESSYRFDIELQNLGQAIWDKEAGYELAFVTEENAPFEYFFSDIKDLEPLKGQETSLFVKTKNVSGRHCSKIALKKNGVVVAEAEDWCFTILPLPSLTVKLSLFPKFVSSAESTEIQLYDEKEGLVYKKSGIRISKGAGVLDNVQNIVLGKKYRLVVLIPHYLPRQTFVTFARGANSASLKQFLPFDFNGDGKLGWDDIGAFYKNPSLFTLLIP